MSQQRVKSVYASYKKSLGTKTITVKETAITKTLSSNIFLLYALRLISSVYIFKAVLQFT